MKQSIKILFKFWVAVVIVLSGAFYYGDVQDGNVPLGSPQFCLLSGTEDDDKTCFFHDDSILPSQSANISYERQSFSRCSLNSMGLYKKKFPLLVSQVDMRVRLQRVCNHQKKINSQKKNRGYYIYQLEEIIIWTIFLAKFFALQKVWSIVHHFCCLDGWT